MRKKKFLFEIKNKKKYYRGNNRNGKECKHRLCSKRGEENKRSQNDQRASKNLPFKYGDVSNEHQQMKN